jgi:hypothetical protein
MQELLFEQLTKTEQEQLKKSILKDIKDEFEKMVEKEVLSQLKSPTKPGNNIVKEIISNSLIKLFKVLWTRSNLINLK